MEENASNSMPVGAMIKRFLILLATSVLVGVISVKTGALEVHQATAVSVFLGIIIGTLFFWNFRLAIAFLGLSVLICSNSLDIPRFVQSSALEVILFLVGMMIIVGALRDLGFFTWIVQLIVSMPNISGRKFIAVTAAASALLACAVDEVTSIIFISTLVFQVCDRLKLDPVPYILICVLCTNVGSAGTMMGNPVGIYIGTKGGLTFGDFMICAFPIMLTALAVTIAFTIWFYRKELAKFDVSLQDRLAHNLSLAPVVEVPYMRGLILICVTIFAIAMHHPLENLLGIGKNSILLIAPLICSGFVMILRRERARYYVEREVDWWTLLFFMLLFAIAGTLEHTKVDVVMAEFFSGICGTSHAVLIPFVLAVTSVGSAFVDNVIFVAAFCPVIEQLSYSVKDYPLWWALLFGACFGGNITMIGSTANIVALGMLEKRSHFHMGFFRWLKVGGISALLAVATVWGLLMAISPLMPDRCKNVPASMLSGKNMRSFAAKNAEVAGTIRPAGSGDILPGEDAQKYKAFIVTVSDGVTHAELPVYVDPGEKELLAAANAPGNRKFWQGTLKTAQKKNFMILKGCSEKSLAEH